MFAVYHRCDVRLRLWISGTKRKDKKKIPRMDEERAVNEGADLMGELFIIGVASGMLLYWEVEGWEYSVVVQPCIGLVYTNIQFGML